MRSQTDQYASAAVAGTLEPRFVVALSWADADDLVDQNLLTYSEQFDNAAWTLTGSATRLADQVVAPDGTTTADELEDPDGSIAKLTRTVAGIDGTARHVLSFFLRKDTTGRATRFPAVVFSYNGSTPEGSIVSFDTETGELNSSFYSADSNGLAGMIDHSPTWWRCWIAVDSVDTANNQFTIDIHPAYGSSIAWVQGAAATGSVYLWGAQLSESERLLAYVQTEATAATAVAGYDSDEYFFTSHADCLVPVGSGGNSIRSVVSKLSGQSQKIKPDGSQHSIGNVLIDLVDLDQRVTNLINYKNGFESMRRKRVRVYKGFSAIADNGGTFDDYQLLITYLVDSVKYHDKLYTLNCSDIQRTEKTDIFELNQGVLTRSISASTSSIPVTISDPASKFELVDHGVTWAHQASDEVGYIIIDDEIICHSGWNGGFTHLTVVQRGALGTKPRPHNSDAERISDRREVLEYVYLDLPAPKLIYALLTGILYGQTGKTLPAGWHLSIPAEFVRVADFEEIGSDLWDTSDDTGRIARFMGVEKTEGKEFIQDELLFWLGCFNPVYSDGALGLERLRSITPDAAFDVELTDADIVSYTALEHDYKSVINNILVAWNWVHTLDRFTKFTQLVDADSLSKHGKTDLKVFEFKGVFQGAHSDNDIQNYFIGLLERYANPPLLTSVTVFPWHDVIEVGDLVRLNSAYTLDYNDITNANGGIDQTFEVQQVKVNWLSGLVTLNLFGGVGTVDHASLASSNVLQDAYYTSEGTELSTVLTIVSDAVTTSGTLSGGATTKAAGSIFYYDGDLTINAGVVVTCQRNVQIRVKGFLTIEGDIVCEGSASDTGRYGKTSSGQAIYGSIWYGGQDQNPNFLSCRGGRAAQRSSGKANLPIFNIRNEDGSAPLGVPGVLSGRIGLTGATAVLQYRPTPITSAEKTAAGGAPGAGGGGLLVVSRGASIGIAGQITTSGEDGAIGSSTVQDTFTVYGQTGAPGYPGGVLFLIDGNYSTPFFTSDNIRAFRGDHPIPTVNKDLRNDGPSFQISPSSAAYGYQVIDNRNRWRGMASVQFIPPAQNGYTWTPTEALEVAPNNGKTELVGVQLQKLTNAGYVAVPIYGVAYGNGTFVQAGLYQGTAGSAAIWTSPEGFVWTQRTSAMTSVNDQNTAVDFANGLFIAMGFTTTAATGWLQTSPDGITWTQRTLPQAITCYGMAYGAGLFVVVGLSDGTDATIFTSPDGITWTERAPTVAKNISLTDVAFGNETFVAIGSADGTDAYCLTSTDGITWTEQTTPANKNMSGIAFGGGTFVAVGRTNGGTDAYIIYSDDDGATWAEATRYLAARALNAVIYARDRFVAVGEYWSATRGSVLFVSADGRDWQVINNDAQYEFTDIAHDGRTFILPTLDTQGEYYRSGDAG